MNAKRIACVNASSVGGRRAASLMIAVIAHKVTKAAAWKAADHPQQAPAAPAWPARDRAVHEPEGGHHGRRDADELGHVLEPGKEHVSR